MIDTLGSKCVLIDALPFSPVPRLPRAFTFHPNLAVCENLFLPNRHGAFEFADGPLAGLERGAAVRRADGDDDAGLADFGATSAMDDADVRDLETLVGLASESFELAERHWRVSFVDQMKGAASARPLARVTV